MPIPSKENLFTPTSELQAGIAVADITPPVGTPMCGYAERPSGATGIHDPLKAKALVLRHGSTSLALVACDLVWFYSDRVVNEARQRWGLDQVVLLGTHTHSGPQMRPDAHADPDQWYRPMENRVVDLIGEADANRFPACIRSVSGQVDSPWFAYNRRDVQPDGTVRMLWSNPERRPVGPVDPTLRLLRIDDRRNGCARLIAAHFACHPVVLGPLNTLISADFAGFTTARIESRLGPGVTAMFLQGGGGDVHSFERGLHGAKGFEVARRTGESLADEALRILAGLDGVPASDPVTDPLSIGITEVMLGYREAPTRIDPVGVLVAIVNNSIALAAISGEPFVGHQLDLVARSPIDPTLLLGYAWFGKGIPLPTYLPTRRAAAEGGYGAAVGSANILEVGAGERLIDAALSQIRHLTRKTQPTVGRARPLPP